MKQEQQQHEQCQAELEKLQSDMTNIRQELEDIKTAAAMSEQAKQDEIDSIRQHYEQEISSMQQLLGG